MSTGERTGAAKLKWVVIVDQSLSPGQAVNAAVCVSAATAPAVPGLLGPGGPDAAEQWHPGLPWAGCSILSAGSAQMTAIRQQALERQLLAADMPAAAQATRVYDDYLRELAKTHPGDLAVLAVSAEPGGQAGTPPGTAGVGPGTIGAWQVSRRPAAPSGALCQSAWFSAGRRFWPDEWLNTGHGGARVASGLDRADGRQGLPDVRCARQG